MALTRLGPNQAVNLSTNTTGTLGVANGGTGLTSGTSGQFLKFTGSTTVASAAAGGKIGQIVFSQAADASYIGTNSSSYVTTGQSVTITPSASSSKVQINVYTGRPYSSSQSQSLAVNIYSSATSAYLGTGDNMALIRVNSASGVLYSPFNIQWIDSPNTTSAVTYTPFMKSSSSYSYFAHEDSVWHIQATEILA